MASIRVILVHSFKHRSDRRPYNRVVVPHESETLLSETCYNICARYVSRMGGSLEIDVKIQLRDVSLEGRT